jgi:Lrp/AsnC family leucine-responsive transcriptional regulator
MHTHVPRRGRHSFNDKIDHRILHVLQKDGRISNLQLAERVHLSPSAVFERVKRLQREGYILGYQARLSHEKLGMEVIAFVEVRLERMNSVVMQRFEEAVRQHPPILECHMIAGTFDYLLKVLVSDMPACHALVASAISKLPGVREARTHAGIEPSDSGPATGSVADSPIDSVDARLLRLLQTDGRCSVARLAEESGVAPAGVRERLTRLCRQGFILGYAAVLNEAKLKSGLLVFAAIRTTAGAIGIAHDLKAAAQSNDEIVEYHEVTGNFDHLLKMRVSDMRRHNELMESVVWPLAGVREVRTYAVIDEVKNTARIPL